MSVQNEEFDTTAAVGLLCQGNQFLVIQRSQSVIAPGQFCFPGGSVESGESVEQALIREFREEVKLVISPVQEVCTSLTSWRCKVHWWTVHSNNIRSLQANVHEVAACYWKTIDEMLAEENLLESNRQFLERVLSGEISL